MPNEKATVQVRRARGGLTDLARTYEVVIDGELVGRLEPTETGEYEVSPGPHELFLRIDWGRSEPVEVHLSPGQTARFHCEPRANLLTDIYWITFGRKRYIRLTELPEPVEENVGDRPNPV